MRATPLVVLALALLPASALVPLAGCGGQSKSESCLDVSGSGCGPAAQPAQTTISASGGSLLSSDGHFELRFPANAVTQPLAITISSSSNVDGTATSPIIYSVSTGNAAAGEIKLAAPATLVLHYEGMQLGYTSPSQVRIGQLVDGKWHALAGYSLDGGAHTITATTTTLSAFSAQAASTVLVCLQRSGTYACPVSGSSSSSSSSGGSTSSSGAATPAPDPSCAAPTCAELNPCADVPTATQTTCSVASDGSWSATCCYDPNVPYCWESGGGSSGSSSGSAPAPVIDCSTATCGDDGATMQSCTNYPGGNGYDETCCYPPGVLPSNEPSGSSSSSGGTAGGTSSSSGSSSGGGSTSGGSTSSGSSGSSSGG